MAESEHFFCAKDLYPVAPGHSLVISKRHTPDYFSLTDEEKQDLTRIIDVVCDLLRGTQAIDGFNIGTNAGKAAGQTIFHTHIHIIPRTHGDLPNPEGGIRNMMPNGRYMLGQHVE